MKKTKISDSATNWEKEIYGAKFRKLKVKLSPKPSALLEAHKQILGDKTDDEAIRRLIVVGSIKFSEIDKLKEQMEQLTERVKSLQEENDKLWKKEDQRTDFFITWAADKQGFEALLRTGKHFEECHMIEEKEGPKVAQKYHEDYLRQLYESRDDMKDRKDHFIN